MSTAALLGTLICLALAPSPALGSETHAFAGAIGAAGSTPPNPNPLGHPGAVAVDNSGGASSGDIYVTDPENHRVEKFDASGHFILTFGKEVNQTEVNSPGSTAAQQNICTAASRDTCKAGSAGRLGGALEAPTFIAVDSSASPSSGDVYVADTGDGFVTKFESSGTFVAAFATVGHREFHSLAGVAVDGVGNLFVLEGENEDHLLKLSEGGGTLLDNGVFRGTSEVGLAIDAEGNLYKADGSPEVSEVTPQGQPLGEVDLSGNTTGLAIDPTTNDLYVVDGGEVIRQFAYRCTQTSSCSPPKDEFGNAEHLTGGRGPGIAADGTIYVANGGADDVSIFDHVTLPDVTTGPSDPTQTSARLTGHIDPAGGGEITSCHFEYGLDTKYGLGSVPCQPAPPYAAPGNVTAEVTELASDTPYHYRLVAANGSGVSVGKDETTIVHAVVDLTTGAATGITRTAATLHGSYEGNGEDTRYRFEYVTQAKFDASGFKDASLTEELDNGLASGPQALAITQANLTPQTNYHFRVLASNSVGTSRGREEEFETNPALAGITTEAATDVSGTAATLNGSVDGNGEETHYYFEWGFTSSYGHKEPATPMSLGSPTGHVSVPAAALSGLNPTTTYHYRLVGENSVGTTFGDDLAVTTLTFPRIEARQTTELKPTSVRLNALVEPTSGSVTTCEFEYGLTAGSYGSGTVPCEAGLPYTGETNASAEIAGLSPGTVYHYRVVLTSPAGTARQPDQTFSSAPLLPTIASQALLSVSSSGASVSSDIEPGFGPTLYFVEFGETDAYGSSSPIGGPVSADNQSHSVIMQINGLAQNRTYHFRAVAINFAGSAHGPDQTFVTSGAPQVVSASAQEVSATSASVSAQIISGKEFTTYHFEYGTGSVFDSRTPESGAIGSDDALHAATASLSGLSPNTTYHFRAVATNSVGVTRGLEGTFTTPPAEDVERPVQLTCKAPLVRRGGKCVKKHHHKQKHRKRGHRG
jgi:hypothetical protein